MTKKKSSSAKAPSKIVPRKPPKEAKPKKEKKEKKPRGESRIIKTEKQKEDESTGHVPQTKQEIEEVRDQIVRATKSLVSNTDELKKLRKEWKATIDKGQVDLKTSIESNVKEDDTDELREWRRAVQKNWQQLEEAEAGAKTEIGPIVHDIKALQKSIREQIKNINQSSFKF